jgi:hypothetical protein
MEPMFVTLEVFQEPMGWLNAPVFQNMLVMSHTCEVFHPPMSSLNELESKTTPPHSAKATAQFANSVFMLVTRLVSQLGMSSHPAEPHRAELGLSQFGSVEQQLAPDATAPRQFFTAILSASLSANGAASAPGTHATISIERRESIPFFSKIAIFVVRVAICPRDARPDRSTPGLSRPCEVDVGLDRKAVGFFLSRMFVFRICFQPICPVQNPKTKR